MSLYRPMLSADPVADMTFRLSIMTFCNSLRSRAAGNRNLQPLKERVHFLLGVTTSDLTQQVAIQVGR